MDTKYIPVIVIVGLIIVGVVYIITRADTASRTIRKVTPVVREQTQQSEEGNRHEYAGINLQLIENFLTLAETGAVSNVSLIDVAKGNLTINFQTPKYKATMAFDPRSRVGTIKHLHGESHYDAGTREPNGTRKYKSAAVLQEWLESIADTMNLVKPTDPALPGGCP